jgi:cell wall-associated NlpC family hydrolase
MNKGFNFMFFLMSMFIVSCSSSRNVTSYKKTNHTKTNRNTSSTNIVYRSSHTNDTSKESKSLLRIAKSFIGVPYKYGGNNASGFDCSGLVMVSFDGLGFKLPRNSAQQAERGKEIKVNDVKEGDLIFFNTSGSSISHVGIVESIDNSGQIKFIHSSTTKGVMISSLEENYWKARFVKAVRLL